LELGGEPPAGRHHLTRRERTEQTGAQRTPSERLSYVPGSLLHPFAKPTRETFIQIERGEGALLWTADGKQLIDGMASLWYCAIGHGRSEMAEAISAQASKLAAYSCFDPFTVGPAEQLADELAAIAPMADARVFLTCSGSEAIDSVMKLARIAHVQAGHGHRKLIISRTRGYHGVAYGGTSAQGIQPNRDNFGPFVDDVVQVPADDVEALASLMTQRGNEVAAVIVEPVQGAGGIWPPTEGYLESVRRLCDQHGAYLIFDEVITGFGRLGSWFAAHHFGVRPDFVTFAKGVTSGYQPLGGVFVGPQPRAALESDSNFFLRHGFTYSGHATACAAASKNLEILQREQLVDRAKHVGAQLADGFAALASDGIIHHTRGEGAMRAVALREGVDSMAARDRLFDLGVICRALPTDTLVFCPPLVITDSQLAQLVDAVATVAAD
jgi:putrescine---pyruvate transaminase